MENPLLRSIRSSVKMNDVLADMFVRAGSISENTGYIVRAYRNANRALPQALKEPAPLRSVRDVMDELRVSLRNELRTSFTDSFNAGIEESTRQLKFYGIETPVGKKPIDFTKQVDSALDAVLSQVEAQGQAINALLMSGIDQTLILGDENRQGVLKPAEIVTGATYWIAAMVWDAFSWWTQSYSPAGVSFKKQSIAALDARTTDCCLRAHGQIVPFTGQFKLTGTPRFADYLEWTPFHWSCRTAIALYLPEYDDGLTAQMQEGANWLLSQRQKGKKPDQHPADAFWN